MLHCVTQYRLFYDVVCFQNVTPFRGTHVNVTVFCSTRNVVNETEDHPVAVREALVAVGGPTNDPPETVAYPGIFFRGVQQIPLRTEDRENGDLRA